MTKYCVTETFVTQNTYIVEADNVEAAKELVMNGKVAPTETETDNYEIGEVLPVE